MMKRIVVGVDGSEDAARALRWAMGLAEEGGAEIIAGYALGPVEDLVRRTTNALSAGLGLSPSGFTPWRNALRRELEQMQHSHGPPSRARSDHQSLT